MSSLLAVLTDTFALHPQNRVKTAQRLREAAFGFISAVVVLNVAECGEALAAETFSIRVGGGASSEQGPATMYDERLRVRDGEDERSFQACNNTNLRCEAVP